MTGAMAIQVAMQGPEGSLVESASTEYGIS
jgi:hypothetical protein